MLAERSQLHEQLSDHSAPAKRIDAMTWGLLLLMTGVLLLLPRHSVPEGAWLIAAGLILLAASAFRYISHLKVSAFIIALGLLAVAAGISAMAGVDLPLFAVFLVLLGGSLVMRGWLARSES